ncbi:MAG: TlpA disulfide reductase family protein [Synergistaceae bacterium]|nr:TlpA disulfide reductase family protein [Synergistaceae bacterium]
MKYATSPMTAKIFKYKMKKHKICKRERFIMKKTLFSFLAAALIIFSLAQTSSALELGSPASDFELADISGKKVKLSDYKGKTVVLNFWATWCPPCRKEMPDFDLLNKELSKTGDAVLLAVNMTDGKRETKSKVESFLMENKYSMRVLLDTEGKAAKAYDIKWLPTTVVVDRKGILHWQTFGETTKETVMKAVEEIK